MFTKGSDNLRKFRWHSSNCWGHIQEWRKWCLQRCIDSRLGIWWHIRQPTLLEKIRYKVTRLCWWMCSWYVSQPIKSVDAIISSGIWDRILFWAIIPASFHGCTVSQNKHYLMLSFPVNVNMPSWRSNQWIIGVPLWIWVERKNYREIITLMVSLCVCVCNFYSEYLQKFVV